MQIRAMHPYAFRSGKWAVIKGTVLLPVRENEPDRACYLVEFPDKVADFWPIDNSGYEYEFRGSEAP